MTKASYTKEIIRGYLVIRFKGTMPLKYKQQLKDLGFEYSKSLRTWTGYHHQDEALDILEETCEYLNRPPEERFKESLCWLCINSDKGDYANCSWVRSFVPVEGWKAEPRYNNRSYYSKIKQTDTEPISYHVISCPLFKKG